MAIYIEEKNYHIYTGIYHNIVDCPNRTEFTYLVERDESRRKCVEEILKPCPECVNMKQETVNG